MLPLPKTHGPGAAASAGRRPFLLPPITERADGRPRRVGVELEFVALTPHEAADLIRQLFGGRVCEISPFFLEVKDGRLGDFRVELDSRHALKQPRHADPSSDLGWFDGLLDDLERELQYLYSVAVSGILPLEIVTPPIAMRDLALLDPLVEALKARGAKGTEESLLYAFGVHLNPEAAEVSAGYVLGILRAYLLLEDWLRREVSPDFLRRALSFITPFGRGYAQLVLDPTYDERRLVGDYLAANPTRYRSLDLLPLLCELDEAQVQARVRDAKVKKRPTFHYRLPDFRTTDPDWSLAGEWNRWVEVEKLAADTATLQELSLAYLAHDESWERPWVDRVADRLGL